MLYARIQDGRVAELVDVDGDPAEHFHESLIFMPAPEGCQPGWILADGALAAAPIDLDALRASQRHAIDAAYETRVAAGIACNGHVYQIDAESRTNIASLATTAGLFLLGAPGIDWPSDGQPYRTMANEWLLLTPAEMITVSQKLKTDFTAIRVRYAGLKDALAAAADAAAIAAIDPNTGWPA